MMVSIKCLPVYGQAKKRSQLFAVQVGQLRE